MAHDRNVNARNSSDGVNHGGAAFKLHCRCACLHEPDCAAHGLFGVHLIRAEWKISNNQSARVGACHQFYVVFHFLKGDGNSVRHPLHDRSNRVSDENHVHTRLIDDSRKCCVVRGDHGEWCSRSLVGHHHGHGDARAG